MPHGAGVIRYKGKRAVVWRIKYRDAAGRHIWETLGREPQWNRERAQRELGKRLAAVDEGYRKPKRTNFATFSKRFLDEYLPGRNLKRTTLENYRYILNGHLLPHFGHRQLTELAARPDLLDGYVSLKAKQGLSAKTIHNHLLLLNVMLRRAAVWRLIPTNPVASIDRPRLEHVEMSVLTEVEIARLMNAYADLAQAAPAKERDWWLLAQAIVATALGTALRRGEFARSSLARRRPARAEGCCARGLRSRPIHDSKEQGFATSDRTRPPNVCRSCRAVAPDRVQGRRRSCFRASPARDAARPEQALAQLP